VLSLRRDTVPLKEERAAIVPVERAYELGKTVRVGQFFEDLARCLLGGEESPDGDFVIWNEGLLGEVKGSDSNHLFRLSTEQLQGILKLSESFPFSRALYILFKYRNRKVGGKTELSRFSDKTETEAFLAKNLCSIHILDARILPGVMEIGENRRKSGSLPCNPELETIDLTQGDLYGLANGKGPAVFASLGGEWEVCEGELSGEIRMRLLLNFEISAKCTLILPPELRRIVIRRLEREAKWRESRMVRFAF